MTFEIALTGLKAASLELESISNNIANSSTVGFKTSKVSFGDIYASAGIGGTGNSIGRGVRVADIAQKFEKGDVTHTERQLDLSVGGSGSGFFKLNDNGAVQYSRAGAFSLDNEGFIVNGLGQKLMGFPAVDGMITPTPGPLQIQSVGTAAQQTEELRLNLNLSADNDVPPAFDKSNPNTYNFSTTTTFYDSLGASHLANMHFRKSSTNTWALHAFVGDIEVTPPAGDTLEFATDGKLTAVNGNPAGSRTLDPFIAQAGTDPLNVTLDLSELTQFYGGSGVNEIVQNGHGSGMLNDFGINPDGKIMAFYSNGLAKPMGQITITSFRNPHGLQQVSNTSWEETFSSGEALTGLPGSSSLGTIESGSLEESNVDITQELVDMISTQRNFQANAQVISTGDQLNQIVMNIKR